MKTAKIVWITVAIALFLLIVVWPISAYNGLITKDESVKQAFADIQAQYQRRADLIPNLVSTVQGAVAFEQGTQTKIAELRTQANALKAQVASAQTPEELQAIGDKIDTAVAGYRGLNINVENYPDLKSNQNFLALQDELAGTENRVAVARTRFNEAVKTYNVGIKRFPTSIIAGMFGFAEKQSFQAAQGAEAAPEVEF